MSEGQPEGEESTSSSDHVDVEEPAAMKLDPPESDHIELSQDGGETFHKAADEERTEG